MTNKCKSISRKMDMYIDGMLSEKESVDFLDHIAKCESCRNEFNALKYMLSLAKEIEDKDPPESLKENVIEMIRKNELIKESKSIFVKRNTFFKAVSTVAAGIAVVFLVYILVGNGFMSSQKSDVDSALQEDSRGEEKLETTIAGDVFEKRESDIVESAEINEDAENETLAMAKKAMILYDITISASDEADLRNDIISLIDEILPESTLDSLEPADEIMVYVAEEYSKELLQKIKEKYKNITIIVDETIKEGFIRIIIE